MIPVLLLFLIVFGLVALYARRRKMLTRLAWREAVRRPGQTVLVIAGLMVGTATITAALVAADSVGDSVVEAFAYRNWGRVDLIATSTGRSFPKDVADRLAASPEVKAVSDGVAGSLELPGSVADLTTRQGSSGVIVVGFDPAAQESFGPYVTTEGDRTFGNDLAPDEVIVSRVLADQLDAKRGDLIRISVETTMSRPEPVALRVAGVALIEEAGGYTLGAAVFAPLPTAQRIAAVDEINIIRISAPGGVRNGFAGARRAAPVVAAELKEIEPSIPYTVSRSKEKEAENAQESTIFIRAMLVAMSFLVTAAGAALIVNLISMLAEERRSQLGVLRALGLKRRSLIGLSVIEGAIYSVAAGLVGTGVGLLAGRLVASRFGEAFAEFAGEDFDFSFVFSLKPETLVASFAIGSVLTLLVILIAARRTSRMTITAAIRNLPEPPPEKARRPRLRAALLVLAGIGGAAGTVVGSLPFRMIGGLALILTASVVFRHRITARLHGTLTGLALAGWSFSQIAGQDPEADAGTFFLVFVFAMLAAVFGLTILAASNLHIAETVVGLLGRAFAGMRAILRPPLAYLARRSVRTGLTTGVFAVVIAMLSLFAVFYVIFKPSYDDFGNGYDVRVLSTGSTQVDLPPAVESKIAETLVVPTRGYIGPLRSTEGDFNNSERIFVPLYAMPDLSAADPPLRLEQRASKYDSDREAWEAVLRDPKVVIGNVGVVGGTVTLQGENGPVKYEIAGIQPFLLYGIFGTPRHFEPIGETPAGATVLLDLKDESQARSVARAVESALFEQGVEADSVAKILDDTARAFRTFFSTIDILMRMGLIVGILALGIVALRVVVERRHVIGVMRAIGYKRRAVMAGIMTEATVTATIGALTGAAVGITMGYLFYRQGDSEGDFGLDWASFGGMLGLVYIAVLLVTLGPAWRASRLPPAEAVRYTE